MKFKDIKNNIFLESKLNSSRERRLVLIEKMKVLNSEDKNCMSCNGMCCSSVFNSVQTTPLETLEVLEYLESQDRLNNSTILKLKQTIDIFRLDKDISLGKGRTFRRTYTCPFFETGPKGCSIGIAHKPYGCLGFNPLEKNVSQEGNCGVYVEAHKKRESLFAKTEDKINKNLKEKYSLYWDKLPMPVALIRLMEAVG